MMTTSTTKDWEIEEEKAQRAYQDAFREAIWNNPGVYEFDLPEKDTWIAIVRESPFSWSYLGGTPKDYACTKCGVVGLKMWRRSHTSCVELLCMTCGKKDQAHKDRKNNLFGNISDFDWRKSDQLGSLIPAIPTQDGESRNQYSFWGYTSVPELGCEWWKNLPDVPIGYLQVRDE